MPHSPPGGEAWAPTRTAREVPLTSEHTGAAPRGLHRFNAAPEGDAEAALLACCGSRRWARRIARHRPYPDLDALLAAAAEASYDLTAGDLAEALAEESGVPQPLLHPGASVYRAAETALRAAHAAYESRFGHVFVVHLDDLPSDQILDRVLTALRTRLNHSPEEERPVAAEELRRVAGARLAHLVTTTERPAVPQ
ncbi:2-oxo-4-hydroxy-4-carboxy-5-ureidoimidazoline decarboxylase [Streptomyces capparidis]